MINMNQNKKLLVAVMLVKMMIVQLAFYSLGMYILGVTKNMWLSSIAWSIGAYCVWIIFEKYMLTIRQPDQWIKPIDRTNEGKKIWR